MASSSTYNTPCAACKFLRRKCIPDCIFAPYFPPEEPQKFANVHKIFGASNVTKILNELLPHQREDAVNSLAYEAEARVRDPVYGCVSAISFLQRQVERLQKELDAANADLIRLACNELPAAAALCAVQGGGSGFGSNNGLLVPSRQSSRLVNNYGVRRIAGGGHHFQGEFYHPNSHTDFGFAYSLPFNFNNHGNINGGGGGEGGGANI